MTLHDAELTQIKHTFKLTTSTDISDYTLYVYENDFYTVNISKRNDEIGYVRAEVKKKDDAIEYLPNIFANSDLFDENNKEITLEIQTVGIGSLSSEEFTNFIKASEIGLKCMEEIKKAINEVINKEIKKPVVESKVENKTRTNGKLERLIASLEKSESKVEKIKNTINRNFKLLDKKIAVVAELGYVIKYDHLEFGIGSSAFEKSYEDMEEQRWNENHKNEDSWALYDVFKKLDDLNSNHRKLAEAEKVVMNWKEKILKEQENVKINETAPQIIVDFIDAWGRMAFDWYMHNTPRPDEEYLRNMINNEKDFKVRDLIHRVEGITGKITDADYLSIGEKGDLTGYITGENGRAWVETISAGGYNIQCFHFRTIVTKG